jgi:hypothetical protein
VAAAEILASGCTQAEAKARAALLEQRAIMLEVLAARSKFRHP